MPIGAADRRTLAPLHNVSSGPIRKRMSRNAKIVRNVSIAMRSHGRPWAHPSEAPLSEPSMSKTGWRLLAWAHWTPLSRAWIGHGSAAHDVAGGDSRLSRPTRSMALAVYPDYPDAESGRREPPTRHCGKITRVMPPRRSPSSTESRASTVGADYAHASGVYDASASPASPALPTSSASRDMFELGRVFADRQSNATDGSLSVSLEALYDASRAPPSLGAPQREAFARGIAASTRQYGAHRDDRLSPHGVHRLIHDAIDLAAFGEVPRSALSLANGTLVRAARERATFESARTSLRDAYGSALNVTPDVARWISNERLRGGDAVLAHDDLDQACIFGSLLWVDMQSGAIYARAHGMSPFSLTPRNLTALADAVGVAVRNGTVASADWLPLMHDVAVFHALHEGMRDLDTLWTFDENALPDVVRAASSRAYASLAASFDRRWALVEQSLTSLAAVAQTVHNAPAGRRALASAILDARVSAAHRRNGRWRDAQTELYMSYPDGRTTQLQLPNLDVAYAAKWGMWEAWLAGNLTRLLSARTELAEGRHTGMLQQLGAADLRHVQVAVPRLQCVVQGGPRASQSLRSRWDETFDADNGTAIIRIDGVGARGAMVREYWAVNATALLDTLISSDAASLPRVRAHRLNEIVSAARDLLFGYESCEFVDAPATWRTCDVVLRNWTPASGAASVSELISRWIAFEIRRAGHEAGYERTWRQDFGPDLLAFLKSLVPLWGLVESIQRGDADAIGPEIVNTLLVLTSFVPPVAAMVRGVTAVSKAGMTGPLLRQAIGQLRSGKSVLATVREVSASPTFARWAAVSHAHGRSIAKELGRATLGAFDPGVELAVSAGRSLVPYIGHASEQLGRGMRAAFKSASVPELTRSPMASRFETIAIGGRRRTVARDTRRPNGLFHYYGVDPADGLPYGSRFAIGVTGHLVNTPVPSQSIALERVPGSTQYEGSLPHEVRVEWWPALETRETGKPVIRIDEAFYEIDLDAWSGRLSRVAIHDVRTREYSVSGAPRVEVFMRGTKSEPMLSVKALGERVAHSAAADSDALFVVSRDPFEVTPTPAMTKARVDASGVLLHDGKRYVRIDGKYYFLVRDTDGVRLCLKRALWKTCLPIEMDSSSHQWRLAGLRRMFGGADAGTEGLEHLLEACRRELPAHAFETVRSALARRDSIIDLSAFVVAGVPNFVRGVPWLNTLILRPGPGAFLLNGAMLGGVRHLRLVDVGASIIGASKPDYSVAANAWLDLVEIVDSPQLWRIDFSDYPVGTFIVENTPKLSHLVIAHAQLERIRISGAQALSALDLRDNLLEDFRVELVDAAQAPYSNLRHVSLASNRLSRLPESLRAATSITHLDLSHNRFETIDDLAPFADLMAIGLSGNRLESIDALGLNRQLRTIYCASNAIRSIDGIRHLEWLLYLDLSRNALTEFPSTLKNRGNLGKLLLDHNTIREVPSTIVDFRMLSMLSLSENRIAVLPPEMGACSELMELYVNDNLLTDLPAAMSGLTDLRMLAIAGNQLRSLPAWIGRHRSLIHLYAGRNQLRRLPAIMDAPRLWDVDLSSNELGMSASTRLPAAFGREDFLPAIQHLRIASNGLTDISDFPVRQALSTLDVSGNPIDALPPSLGECDDLMWLNLERCRFTTLPSVLDRMTAASVVRIVDGNPLSEQAIAQLHDRADNMRGGARIFTGSHQPAEPMLRWEKALTGQPVVD